MRGTATSACTAATTTPRCRYMLLGGHGVISVTANVAPKRDGADVRGGARRRHRIARAINDRLMPLHRKLFVEANPIARQVGAGRDGAASQRTAAAAGAARRRSTTRRPRRAARRGLPSRKARYERMNAMHPIVFPCAAAFSRPHSPPSSRWQGLRDMSGSRRPSASTTSRRAAGPPLELPPDLTTPRYDDRYRCPPRRGLAAAGRNKDTRSRPAAEESRRARSCAPATSAGSSSRRRRSRRGTRRASSGPSRASCSPASSRRSA